MQSHAHTVSRSNFKHHDMRTTRTGPGRSGQSHQNEQTSFSRRWSDDDDVLSPGAPGYYNELFALYTQEDPIDTAPARDLNNAQDNLKPRPATVFPGNATSNAGHRYADGTQYLSEQQKGNTPAKKSFLKKHFKEAKEIYKNGPPGEAEALWTGIRTYLHNREPKEVTEMVPPKKRYETRTPPTKPAPARGANKAPALKQVRRQDSVVSNGNVSRTSREIPIMLGQPVDLNKPLPLYPAAEVNKPLPRYPPVDAAFGQRPQQGKGKVLNVNKPLPPTPLPCSNSPIKRAKASDLESPVDPKWASIGMQTIDETIGDYASPEFLPQRTYQANLQAAATVVPQTTTTTRQPLQPLPVNGCQTPAGKYTLVHGSAPPAQAGKYKPSRTEKEREKARTALKAKISRPVPVESHVDISAAHVQPQYKFERRETEERQKAAWLDKIAHPTLPAMPDLPALNRGRKRRDSDASFACQGVGGQGEYRPAPLSTGEKGDASGHRMTGRWI
jgi:hypothetical protein